MAPPLTHPLGKQAYLAFMGDTPDIAAVAERFGQTVRYVEGRLRLAKLAKPIFAALSKGEISLELAAAYCSTTDQTKQIAVWKDHSGRYGHSFANVRRAINDGAIGSDHPIARFVGEAAYLGAGGRVERELFRAATRHLPLGHACSARLSCRPPDPGGARSVTGRRQHRCSPDLKAQFARHSNCESAFIKWFNYKDL